MDKLYDVVIAGGGPIGLCLACELGLAGSSVLVLERDPERESPWKISPLGLRGINTQSVEAFYRRGLLNKILGSGIFDPDGRPQSFQKKPGFAFGGHFAGIMMNANKLELDRFQYRINGPALQPGPTTLDRVESALSDAAVALGVMILRGHSVKKIAAPDEHAVTVETADGQFFRGKWLVGCDGGRSVVRKAAAFDFPGTEPKFTAYAVYCDLEHAETLKPGFNPTKTGMYITGAKPGALYLVDFDGGAYDRGQEITREHIQEVLCRVSGMSDIEITQIHLASAFTDSSRQVTSYRKGRVLLAGDAAHIHPPLGSQGLNVGIGDAMNLGWKLAATVRREAQPDPGPDFKLLDTYEAERRPIAAWVLDWTRAQVSTIQPDEHGAAMQRLIRDVIDTTDGANLFIDRAWGLTQRYDLGDTHPLVGMSAPDFEMNDGLRLGDKMHGGHGLLVDFTDDEDLRGLVACTNLGVRVDYVGLGARDARGLRALLVRPDGIVAWVAEEDGSLDVEAAKLALGWWFGF
ncbi:putative pentachlorophenol 4-monooxygenase [Exophiala viscosa]|uniref:Pentachlorophenol 4-monooxygenase n=1 Tax=Exophiala viscosa TaxID=2486360 RepID=A0AAN6E6R1_9EURO|nr:putative pentachlorophenol 4-monooxygenase [Exophiala viscosa]KAI1628165.1 putative pentachlorophenol 4-monooxygenase [Exophiala viscosa]